MIDGSYRCTGWSGALGSTGAPLSFCGLITGAYCRCTEGRQPLWDLGILGGSGSNARTCYNVAQMDQQSISRQSVADQFESMATGRAWGLSRSERKDLAMGALFPDTHPQIEALQIQVIRRLPAWKKLSIVDDLNETVRTLAISGIKQRRPAATPAEVRRMLAGLMLGEELASKVYDCAR